MDLRPGGDMAEPFLGEIRMVGFNYAPQSWAFCNGQALPINQNQALFALLGTTFGGNGQTTFQLPDLRGRTPIHAGGGFSLGTRGGEPAHTITMNEMAQHLHQVIATSATANQNTPANTLMLATSTPQNIYGPATALVAMAPQSVVNVGGSQAHENMQPYLTLSFCIALQGIFPSQN